MTSTSTLDKPWWRRWTFWSTLLAMAAGLPGFVPELLPILPPEWHAEAKGIALLAGYIAVHAARRAGVRAATKAVDAVTGDA